MCSNNGAKLLRREAEFGSLEVGKVDNILIVKGNPVTNISDSRNVEHVFMRGNHVDRRSLKLAQ